MDNKDWLVFIFCLLLAIYLYVEVNVLGGSL